MATMTANQIRSELGDFSSITCFRALVTGTEEALGEKAAAIALIAAGRARGKQLAAQLGFGSQAVAVEALAESLKQALGAEGTRLCIVDQITHEGEAYRVYCRETICSASEPAGSCRKLTYTLGALQGVLEQATGKRLRGQQIESVLRGGQHDVVEFTVLG